MKEFNLQETAKRIKFLRVEKQLDQNAFAKEIKVSHSSISYWENAKQIPSAEVIYKMAVYFGVSVDYILGLKDE